MLTNLSIGDIPAAVTIWGKRIGGSKTVDLKKAEPCGMHSQAEPGNEEKNAA
jgi:hypothetical protein